MTDIQSLVADLREAAKDRQHLGTNALRFILAADALEALTSRAEAAEAELAEAHTHFAIQEGRIREAEARIAEALALHTLFRSNQSNGWTGDPFDECRECSRPWPCLTVRILKGES